LGGTSFSTPSFHLVSHGFSGWMTFSQTFTANSASEVLSFLGVGRPAVPPFPLLDNVSLTPVAAPTPEPSAIALMGLGLVGIGLVRRFRNRRASA
jgi:hypothetical protein